MRSRLRAKHRCRRWRADTGFDPSSCLGGAIMPGTEHWRSTAETRRHSFPMITDGATAPPSCGAMAGSAIEIEVAGMIVRVRGRVMAEALVEVLAAVKRAR